MKTIQNDDGTTTYRLETFVDLAVIPDEVLERNGGWMMLEAAINTIKMHLVAAHISGGDDAVKRLLDAMPNYIDLKDDGQNYVQTSVNGDPLLKVSITKNGGE